MPDLGKYADTVILAYIVSFVFLIGLVGLTWLQSRRAKRILATEETRNGK
ncbi:heme exporter protein CcmD [Amylibacter sp. SFDW26]|nr:heme exporter protein CcmD [Amylibacter sp. SFDW26]KAB7615302.1 heme exporter protein CcmD [Amylibacter sp. SFDW26]